MQAVFIVWEGVPLMWEACRQPFTTLSSAESELVAMVHAVQLAESFQPLIDEVIQADSIISLMGDNEAAIRSFQTASASWRNRHLRMRAVSGRERIDAGILHVSHLPGEFQIADIGTKPLSRPRLLQLLELANIRRPGGGKDPTRSARMYSRSSLLDSAVEWGEAEALAGLALLALLPGARGQPTRERLQDVWADLQWFFWLLVTVVCLVGGFWVTVRGIVDLGRGHDAETALNLGASDLPGLTAEEEFSEELGPAPEFEGVSEALGQELLPEVTILGGQGSGEGQVEPPSNPVEPSPESDEDLEFTEQEWIEVSKKLNQEEARTGLTLVQRARVRRALERGGVLDPPPFLQRFGGISEWAQERPEVGSRFNGTEGESGAASSESGNQGLQGAPRAIESSSTTGLPQPGSGAEASESGPLPLPEGLGTTDTGNSVQDGIAVDDDLFYFSYLSELGVGVGGNPLFDEASPNSDGEEGTSGFGSDRLPREEEQLEEALSVQGVVEGPSPGSSGYNGAGSVLGEDVGSWAELMTMNSGYISVCLGTPAREWRNLLGAARVFRAQVLLQMMSALQDTGAQMTLGPEGGRAVLKFVGAGQWEVQRLCLRTERVSFGRNLSFEGNEEHVADSSGLASEGEVPSSLVPSPQVQVGGSSGSQDVPGDGPVRWGLTYEDVVELSGEFVVFPVVQIGIRAHYLSQLLYLDGLQLLGFLEDGALELLYLRTCSVGLRHAVVSALAEMWRQGPQAYMFQGPQWQATVEDHLSVRVAVKRAGELRRAEELHDAAHSYVQQDTGTPPYVENPWEDAEDDPQLDEFPHRPALPEPVLGFGPVAEELLGGESSSEEETVSGGSTGPNSWPNSQRDSELEEPFGDEGGPLVRYEAAEGFLLTRYGDDVLQVPLPGWDEALIGTVVRGLSTGDWEEFKQKLNERASQSGGSQPSESWFRFGGVRGQRALRMVFINAMLFWLVVLCQIKAVVGTGVGVQEVDLQCSESERGLILWQDPDSGKVDEPIFEHEGWFLWFLVLWGAGCIVVWELGRCGIRSCWSFRSSCKDQGCQTSDGKVLPLPLDERIPHRGKILFCLWKAGIRVEEEFYPEDIQNELTWLIGDYLVKLEAGEVSGSD